MTGKQIKRGGEKGIQRQTGRLDRTTDRQADRLRNRSITQMYIIL